MKETTLVRDTGTAQISGYDYGKAEIAHSPPVLGRIAPVGAECRMECGMPGLFCSS
jgi:hypothetical protein